MCVTSMVGDFYAEKWRYAPQPIPYPGFVRVPNAPATLMPSISREEFDALKREVEDMKALLIRAKKYDEDNGEPDCELDEKLAVLRRVAELVGVDLAEVI